MFSLWGLVGEPDPMCSTKDKTVWRMNTDRYRLCLDRGHPAFEGVDEWDMLEAQRIVAAEMTEPGSTGLGDD